MATPRGPYTWDARVARFRGANGRYVPASAVRDALDKSIDASAWAMREASEALRAGQMSLAQWELTMAAEIRNSHLAATALARGGWDFMTPADYGRAGRVIREQYRHLQKFAAQIASGAQKLDGTLARRASLYIDASRAHYAAARKREMEVLGADEERRFRHARDSCPTCIGESNKGWSPLGTLRPIGDSECIVKCKCTFGYRRGGKELAA
jgi:hypothetical protein